MRRVMLLVLLALALPTGALAGTIHFDTGVVFAASGSGVGGIPPSTDVPLPFCCLQAGVGGVLENFGPAPFSISLTDAPVIVTNSVFVGEIIGGTITVRDSTGATVFQSGVASGEFVLNTQIGASNIFGNVSGTLEPSATVKGGSFSLKIGGVGPDFPPEDTFSSGSVTATLVPEPSALEGLLLGTGLLGLAEMARRKLQFGT